jgi:hypothetical protein
VGVCCVRAYTYMDSYIHTHTHSVLRSRNSMAEWCLLPVV